MQTAPSSRKQAERRPDDGAAAELADLCDALPWLLNNAEAALIAIIAAEPSPPRPGDPAYLDVKSRLLPVDKLADAVRAKALGELSVER